jgi:nucleotide-binding universal stress UspA family protein
MADTQLSPTGRFEKLLLATDASGYGAGAVRVAISLASKSKAHLHAMTVVRTNPEYEAVAHDLVAQAEEEAWNYLDTVVEAAKVQGVACEPIVRRGEDPSREIIEQEGETKPDLIVMGRRGRRGLSRLMVGDATVKVIGTGHCSVLVVPQAADMWKNRILLGTDGSRFADAAAVAACVVAKCCAVPITVVGAMVPSHSEKRQQEGRQAVDRTVELIRKEGVEVDGVVAPGEADQVLIATAESRNADLMVVGTFGRTGFGRALIGSVAERVIGQAKCPILVAR